MIDLIIAGTAGLFLGVIAGILPGLGTGSLLGLLFIFLLNAPALTVIVFYIGILTSAQYFGSVTAILTGVPGDPAAIPTTKYGHAEAKNGFASELIFLTAKYSLISGLLSFLLLLFLLHLGIYWTQSLSTISQSFIFLIAIILLITLSTENPRTINWITAIIGLFIGAIGYSANFQTYFLVDASSPLRLGVPWLPVLTGLLVVPGLLSLKKLKINSRVTEKKKHTTKLGVVAARGGVIGFILGTVPGLSYILSSIVAAAVESKISNNNTKVVVAAESANNAGAVSVLLPLLLLGIPITASESIVFSILTANASISSLPNLILDHWKIITFYFFIINCILFIAAWKFAVPLCRFLFSNTLILFAFAVILSIGGVLWLGNFNHQLLTYIITLAVASAIGVIIKIDWSITIFAMLLYPHIEKHAYQILQLYF